MALYMWMARYTPAAAKAIADGGSNREEMARKTVEAAGGKLLGFYGLMGQEHHIALICDMPGMEEYLGVVMAASAGGAIESWKTVPMYDYAQFQKAVAVRNAVSKVYAPPRA